MGILANAYFDVVAVSRGLVVLFFCVPIVLLCEYEVYRILYPRQGRIRSAVTCIYANIISWIAGVLLAEGIIDWTVRMSQYLFGKGNDVVEESILMPMPKVFTRKKHYNLL